MKKNLAKVLGLEELQEVAPPAPSDEQVMQQQTTELSDYMQQTADATEVALESISNALQLQSVIQNSSSTDPTAYAVLRTAVEQLKERTGVKTQTVALEDLSPLSYKTEAIEDIKKFAAKVWEAIKKAFAAMWEKIKAFFSWMFNKSASLEKKAEEVKEELNEFEKELKKAPKSEREAKNYSSDYFGIKKNYFEDVKSGNTLALGYTQGTGNVDHTKDRKFSTSDKQPEYSGRFNEDRDDYEKYESHGAHYSQSVKTHLLTVETNIRQESIKPETIDAIISNLSKAVASIIHVLPGIEEDPEDTWDGKPLFEFKTVVGAMIFKCTAPEGVLDLKIESEQHVKEIPSWEGSKIYPIVQMGGVLEEFKVFYKTFKRYREEVEYNTDRLNKSIARSERELKAAEDFKQTSTSSVEQLKVQRDRYFVLITKLQSNFTTASGLLRYAHGLYNAVMDYLRETMNHIRRIYKAKTLNDGWVRDVREFNKVMGFTL
jgi:hypothetical protein